MADWEEIKRLAADFQQTQTIETINRISERNCIDIIKKLIELDYIEIIYSCDGKELITPEQLIRDIEDEVYKNGGRMHLHELAAKLNVDYQHVENKANQLVKSSSDYNLILGQLIHSIYKEALAKRINHTLLIEGQLSVSEFAKTLDLPSDYLIGLLDDILKSVSNEVVRSQDGQTIYTSDTMDRYKSIIVGTLTAISKPTTIASLVKRLNLQERIMLPIVEGLIKEGRIDASVENRQFIPASYARQQNEYINKFYVANSYIEYDVISRMDIKQPKIFLKKKFPDGIQLKTCLISPLIITQVESMLEETIASNGWIDISTIVPSSIEASDIDEILAIIFKKSKDLQSSCLIFDDTYVCSRGYVEICKRLFEGLMPAKADQDLKSGKLIAHFMVGQLKQKNKDDEKHFAQEQAKDDKDNKDDYEWSDDDEPGNKRAKGKKSHASGGGGGAASQGREVKNKNVKKKYFVSARGSNKKGGGDFDNNNKKASQQRDENNGHATTEPLTFQQPEEMKRMIQRQSSDECSDEFLLSIVKLIEDDVNKSYCTIARKAFDEFIKAQELETKAKEDESKDKENAHADVDDNGDHENKQSDNDETEKQDDSDH